MIPRIATLSLLAWTGATFAAHAGMCVVDPETLEIRDHLTDADNEYLLPDETGATLEWVINGGPLTDHEQRYEKYALPRTLSIGDVALQGFVGAVPLFKASGDPEVPDVVYLLIDPKECRVQPYQKAP